MRNIKRAIPLNTELLTCATHKSQLANDYSQYERYISVFFNKTDILQGTALKHVRPQYPSVKGDGPLIETQKTEAP